MLKHNPNNKQFAQRLRTEQTDAERLLWNKIRKKQIKGYLFSRQKPIGNYIVDFYCHKLKIVIEVDGDLHYLTKKDRIKDRIRDEYFKKMGITVYRATNIEIYKHLDEVVQGIWNLVKTELKNPPNFPTIIFFTSLQKIIVGKFDPLYAGGGEI